jgi:hypothetical protein
LTGAGDYQVGAHTQGSDGGTFWFSNNGTEFDGQNNNPEMAIYAEASGSAVPEPGTCLALFAGLIALAVARRKLA